MDLILYRPRLGDHGMEVVVEEGNHGSVTTG